uniref:Uncharacterized protein n=1 Tax=Oryza punctata TaxID=4537 RepID=A0A0E0JWZ9_ORYPU
MSNRGGRGVTPGLPDLGTTRDERAQQWCQYRAGEVGDQHESDANPGAAAAMLEVDEEDLEWLTMTGADDGGVNARMAMKNDESGEAAIRRDDTTAA